MSRPGPLLVAALAPLALAVACGGAPPQASPAPRHLLVIALDTLRPDHLGCYGYERPTSPQLDAFAREAYVFRGVQSAAPWTAPALTSLFTSLNPEAHGVVGFPNPAPLPDAAVTLAEVLRERGFRTAAFTEGGYARGGFGLAQGFDSYLSERKREAPDEPSPLEANVERLLDWLAQGGEERSFAFFHTYEPHAPLRAPAEYVARFLPDYDEPAEHAAVAAALARWEAQGELDPPDASLLRRHRRHCGWVGLGPVARPAELRARIEGLCGSAPDAAQIAFLNGLYDAEIRYLDDQLARLFAGLERLGRLDETLVLVVSDHGEGLGDHGLLGHGRVLHRELLEVVFVLRVPGHAARARALDVPARAIDALPTLLELLDVDPGDAPRQGRSLAPALDGALAGAPPAHAQATNGGARLRSVRLWPWRLVLDDATGAAALYDLARDPGELRDVAAEHPARVAELRALLAEQRERDERLRAALGEGAAVGELDAATLEELERLGYVGEGTDE